MIDIESAVFNNVANALNTVYPTLNVESVYTAIPAAFPFVSLVEADNYVHKGSQALSEIENHVNVMYEANIFVDKQSGKKMLAKEILNVLDTEMLRMGFTRTFVSQVPNIDRTIFRIVARWEGIVAKGLVNGNTITYLVY